MSCKNYSCISRDVLVPEIATNMINDMRRCLLRSLIPLRCHLYLVTDGKYGRLRHRWLLREMEQVRGAANDSSTALPTMPAGAIRVSFCTTDGDRYDTYGKAGDSLLDVVVDRDIPLDGFGACEGTLACSTCHVVMKQHDYDRFAKPVDEELDMLDLAFDLCETSRLGCQIILTKDVDGLEVQVPSGTRDARTV